jgi:hypothetical protein
MILSDTDQLLDAEDQALQGLLGLLSEQESDLAGPIRALIAHVEAEIKANEACIERCRRKLQSSAGKHLAGAGNALDSICSGVLGDIHGHLTHNDMTLAQLGVKGGVLEPGQTLESWIDPDPEPEPQYQWGGVLVLSVKEALPHLDELIEVLKEIRDRLPPVAVGLPKELVSEEHPPEMPVPLTVPAAAEEDIVLMDKVPE